MAAIDEALENERNRYRIAREEQRELFGHAFDDHAAEAEDRWGDSEAWERSQLRTKGYSKEQWQQIKQETGEIHGRYVELVRAGVPAESAEAMDVAEAARVHICRWFYDCPRAMHAGIAEMYVADPRYTQAYEDLAAGLSQYVHDAVIANGQSPRMANSVVP